MDVWEAARIILRRWFVVLPILVLTGVLAGALGDRSQPEYSASSTVVMLAPFRTNGETGTAMSNPYLNFNSSLTTTAIILRASLDRSEIRELIATEGLAPNYNVIPQDRSPLVDVTVRTDSAEKATATVNRVVQLLQDDLRARQLNLRTPRDQTITTQVLSPATAATLFNSGRARTRYLVIGLGLFVAALAAFAAEGGIRFAARRKARRTAVTAAAGRAQTANRSTGVEAGRVESSR